nr:all-trans retinoic acid-induced differentiation factor [Zootoca vivipara]
MAVPEGAGSQELLGGCRRRRSKVDWLCPWRLHAARTPQPCSCCCCIAPKGTRPAQEDPALTVVPRKRAPSPTLCSAILRLDLGNCSLQQLCSSFQEASTALVIDLTDNPLEPLPEDAFRGFTQLQTLVLPPTLDCPGGNEGWENVTLRGRSRVCHGQRNPCNSSGGLGHLCPKDSSCAPTGPACPSASASAHTTATSACARAPSLPAVLWDLGSRHHCPSLLLWVTQRQKAKVS